MKKLLSALLLTVFMSSFKAQDSIPFKRNDNIIGVFIGVGYSYATGIGNITGFSSIPALGLILDHGIVNNAGPGTIGLGGVVGFKEYSYHLAYSNFKQDLKWTNYVVAVRGSYHYNGLTDKIKNLDLYAGISLGIRIFRERLKAEISNHSIDTLIDKEIKPIIGAFIGARYQLTKSFGAFIEIGYDVSYAKVGVAYKF